MLPMLASTPAMSTADLGLVMAIEAAAYSHPWTRGNFVDSLAAGYLARLACDAQGQCMGYFVAMLGAGEMHLLNLTVAPPLQRQGLGQTLLRRLCAEGRRLGATILWLEVRASNQAARLLYANFGFTEVGLRRAYYPVQTGPREDAVVMSFPLEGVQSAVD